MSENRPTRRDLMKPVQLLGFAFAAAVFGGVIALVSMGFFQDLSDDQRMHVVVVSLVVAGIAFIATLVIIALLMLAVDPAQVTKPVEHGVLLADLDANWEVLAEAIQTVVRAEIVAGRSEITDPYALLKELTRGRRVGGPELAAFVEGLDIGEDAKARLVALTPATYTGLADALVDEL